MGTHERVYCRTNRNSSACSVLFLSILRAFSIANLVVIPLITIILYAAVVMLLLTPFSWLQIGVAGGVKKLLEGLNFFVDG